MSNPALAINDAGDVLAFDGQGWKPAPMAANDAGEKVVFDGTAWKPLGELMGTAKGAQPQGRSDALANAIGGGALQNFGDEATAAVRAAAPGLSNFMMSGPALQRDESIGGSPMPQTVSTAPTFQGRYDEELARQRAQTSADSKAYPGMTTAGNIGGMVASTALALPAAATSAAPTLMGNIAKMAATGAALGGVAGAGEGEGTDDRLAKALLGAGVGGVAGGALPLAGVAGRAALETAPGRAISEKVVSPTIRSIANLLGQPTTGKSLSSAAIDKYAVERQANDLMQSYGLPRDVWSLSHGKQATAFADFLQRNGIPFERGRADSGSKYLLVRSSPEEGADMVKVRFANHSRTSALHEKPDFNITTDGEGSHSLDEVISALTGWQLRQSTPGLRGARSLSAAAADGGNFIPPTGLQGVADRASNVAETGAVDRIATALQRAKLDPSQVERRLGQLGDGAMLADTDQQFLSLARGAKVMPGATRSHAETVLTSRDRGAGNRLVSAFEGGEPPPSTFDLAKGMDANRSAVGADVYGTMRGEKLKLSTEMQDLLKTPAIRDAVAQIEQDAKSTGTNLSPIEIAHRVKQKLNDTAQAAFASGKPINKADLRDLAGRWESAFGDANPSARTADAAYAQAASLPEFMGAGRNFLRRGTTDAATEASAPAIGDLLSRADPQQAIAARAGATNAARETALEGTRPARALAQRIDESTPVRDKIVQLYGSRQGNDILQRAATETTFAKTSNDILRGSQTAEKAVDAIDLGGAKVRAGPSGITSNVIERIGDLVTKMTAPNEAVRDAIGRATLNPDSAESRRLLALAAELMKRRASGAPLRASTAEIAASLAGRD